MSDFLAGSYMPAFVSLARGWFSSASRHQVGHPKTTLFLSKVLPVISSNSIGSMSSLPHRGPLSLLVHASLFVSCEK